MLHNHASERKWDVRRNEKQRRIEAVKPFTKGKVLPTQDFPKILEKLIMSGDKVALEGNNQKQADFLARMLVQIDPAKVNNLHISFLVVLFSKILR